MSHTHSTHAPNTFNLYKPIHGEGPLLLLPCCICSPIIPKGERTEQYFYEKCLSTRGRQYNMSMHSATDKGTAPQFDINLPVVDIPLLVAQFDFVVNMPVEERFAYVNALATLIKFTRDELKRPLQDMTVKIFGKGKELFGTIRIGRSCYYQLAASEGEVIGKVKAGWTAWGKKNVSERVHGSIHSPNGPYTYILRSRKHIVQIVQYCHGRAPKGF